MRERFLPIRFTPFRQQAELIVRAHAATIICACAGARGGKTEVGSRLFADWAIAQPGYRESERIKGHPYAMAAWCDTYKMLEDVVLKAVRAAVPPELIMDYNKVRRIMRVRGVNGMTEIYFRTAQHPERSQGLQLYRAWIDEAAIVKKAMFDEARARLANLSGKLLLTTTPRGPNWIYENVYKLVDTEPGYVAFHQWRSIDNPYGIPEEEIELLRRTTDPTVFRRNYEASFEAFEGMVYDTWRDSVHRLDHNSTRISFPALKKHFGPSGARRTFIVNHIIVGIDWGVQNPGVMAVVGRTTDGEYILLQEEHHQFQIADEWAVIARALRERFDPAAWWPDPSDAQQILWFRKKTDIVMRANTMNSVGTGIAIMKNLMAVDDEGNSRFYVWHGPHFCEEIKTYEWQRSSATDQYVERPIKRADHVLDAVRYAVASDVQYRFKHEPNYRATSSISHDVRQYFAGTLSRSRIG